MRRWVMLLVLAAGGTAAAQSPAEQQAAPAPRVEPVAPPPAAAPKPEKAPVVQSTGKGSIGLLLQGWFTGTTDTRFSATATSPGFKPSGEDNAGSSTFRLRRAEMSYDGSLAKIVKYRAMIDPTIIQNGPIAVSGTSPNETVTVKDILQDAYVGVVVPWHEVRLGQFKLPLTMEGYGSSGKLDFAERSLMGRTFGDQRDIGVMILSDKVPHVEYEIALVNGAGKNVYDNSPHKTGVFRAVATPYKGISVGGSAQLGGVFNTGAGKMLHRNRAGVEAALEMHGVSLKAEYMAGVDGQFSSTSGLSANRPAGYYVTGGYRYQNWQGVVRYERYVSDNPTSTEECRVAPNAGSSRCQKNRGIAVGVNYDVDTSILNSAKLQLDYVNDKDEVKDVTAHEVFLVGQVKF